MQKIIRPNADKINRPLLERSMPWAGCGAMILILSVGCIHSGSLPPNAGTVEKQLLLLEQDFAQFVAAKLSYAGAASGENQSSILASCESEVRKLESLRLRYLDLVAVSRSHRHRVTAMTRIAELHLDFGARIRRIAYPDSLQSTVELDLFEKKLASAALPYEAIGLGILRQIDDFATRRQLSGRMVQRAQLYLALHDSSSSVLMPSHFVTLRHELSTGGPFRAPRRLLETGRIGRRAERR
jgi:hypothetical protein